MQGICDKLKAKTQRIQCTPDAFGLDELPIVTVLATGNSMMYGKWGVQIETYEEGRGCLVVLGALSDSFALKMTAAMAGNKRLLAETYSLTGSKKKRDEIANAFR